jgi:hypothetical protein
MSGYPQSRVCVDNWILEPLAAGLVGRPLAPAVWASLVPGLLAPELLAALDAARVMDQRQWDSRFPVGKEQGVVKAPVVKAPAGLVTLLCTGVD